MAAAAAAPAGVTGVFELDVLNTGSERGEAGLAIFLNSEKDYRDQRCLTIVLTPRVLAMSPADWDPDRITHFLNKRIRVTGMARRATIYFYSNGVRTDRYYYQTHVRVTDPEQIEVIGPVVR